MEQSLKRVYIEITNVCNLSCPFCPPLRREKRSMTPEEFAHVLHEIGPYCKNVLLHVKGEPLLSPYLKELLELCKKDGFLVTITTNGTLISQKEAVLFAYAPVIRGFNLSLQGLVHFDRWREELPLILAFCDRFNKEAGRNVVLRLWSGQTDPKNQELLGRLALHYSLSDEEMAKIIKSRSYTIRRGLFISRAEEFAWPGENSRSLGNEGFCYGSLTQLAVLCDGQVVPCCLDGEGEVTLGNLFEEPFGGIFAGERLRAMREGFLSGQAAEELCRRCSYKARFDKKAQRIAQACRTGEGACAPQEALRVK